MSTSAMEDVRAQREAANFNHPLLALAAELRNKIYKLVIPRNKWLTVYTRSSASEITLLHVCRAIRADNLRMYYGDNTFAIDLRMQDHYELAYQWINSLSDEAINSLRKLRISTELECDCKGAAIAKTKAGYHWQSSGAYHKSAMSFIVSIDRNYEEEPFGVSMGFCDYCEERPVTTAAHANRVLQTMDLEEEDSALTYGNLSMLLEILQPLDQLEEDEDDEDDEDEDE